jgi:hypothetical protein
MRSRKRAVKPFEGALRLIRRRGTPPGLGGPRLPDKRRNDKVDQNAPCIGVVNFGFDRSTGKRTVELSFACLEWSKAISICGRIKKLAPVPDLAPPKA